MSSHSLSLRVIRSLLARARAMELSAAASQRLRWFEFALEHGDNVSLTCRHFGIARSTYLRWAERFDAGDCSSLEETSRRPHHVRAPETDAETVVLIKRIREEYPLLSKDAVRDMLAERHNVRVSASTVGRTIARYGLYFAQTPQHERKRSSGVFRPLPQVPDAGMSSLRTVLGTTLAVLVAVVGIGFAPSHALAAQSTNYVLQETGPGNAAGVVSGSTNFRMQGDLGWRQEAPLHSNSFQITTAPPVPVSSAAVSSAAPSSVQPTDQSPGGHRGQGTTTPVSRVSSVSSSSSSSSVSSSSSTSSISSLSSYSSSSISLHGAASSASSIASGPTFECTSILCPERFWHPITLVPVPTGAVSPLPAWLSLALLVAFICFLILLLVERRRGRRAHERVLQAVLLILIAAFALALIRIQTAHAAVSSPQKHVYNGHLLDASGNAITTPHNIRFSEWYDRDMQPTDVDIAGAIDTLSATYAGYQEVFTVTPDAQGYFSVVLGSGAALPDLAATDAADLDNLFLQVEVKAAAAPDTSYETLDVDPTNDAIDRSPVLSVPFAQNADLLDQRELGTGSGSIPVLASGGLLPMGAVPGGTNRDEFVIDANDTASSDITLQFGSSIAETLKYDIADDTFVFSADVKIEGDLVVTGLINGIDISALGGSSDGKLLVSSGGGLTISVTGGGYRLNGDVTDFTGDSGVAVEPNTTNQVFIGSGGLTVQTSGFPTDESFIRLAEVVTNGVSVTQVNDRRIVQSDDREHVTPVVLNAEFPNASYQADAVDNVGQLSVQLDNITLRNFYLWNSTRSTLQDYDVVARVALPADFVRWTATPLAVSYRTTSVDAADSRVDISLFDTNGVPVSLGGSATGLAATSWTTTDLTYAGTPTWTAGQEFLIKVKLSAKDAFQAHLGSIKLFYVRLTP